MYLIDTHCHLDFDEFDRDREKILLHCQTLGIKEIIVPGVTAKSWQRLLSICQSSNMLYPALGLHPMFMDEHLPQHLEQLTELIPHHPVIAIGEIGLDFYISDHNKESQILLFIEQLKIAKKADLPILLHVRKAHEHTIRILKQYSVSGGIVHAFSGSLEQAKEYQKLGFLLGVGGAITNPHATRLRAMISQLPLSSLVLETDAPDMPLFKMNSNRNTPENIPIILDSLANLHSEDKEEVAKIISRNHVKIFP